MLLYYCIPNKTLIIVDYCDIIFNNVCATETQLLKVEMVSDILDHPVCNISCLSLIKKKSPRNLFLLL